ncbi:MAG: 7TM diverse intracellular signaling domain-containing protein [Pseudomonadota bacterium]
MRTGIRAFGVLLLLLAEFVGADSLVLREDQDFYELQPHVRYAHDIDGVARVDDLSALAFSPVDDPSMTFGFRAGIHWFRSIVSNGNHPDSNWVLQIDYALLDRVDLFVLDRAGRLLDHVEGGDLRPFANRAYAQRRINFELPIERGTSLELILRVDSQSSVQVPLRLMTRKELVNQAYLGQFGLGLLYGVLLALLCYNFILYTSTRDATFLYYVCYVGSFGLVQLTLNGLAFQYLWPSRPEWSNTALLLGLSVGLVAIIQFCRTFLDLRRNLPVLDQIFRGFMVWAALLAVAAFFVSYRVVVITQTATVFPVVVLIFIAALGTHLRGFPPARYFLLAWFVLLLGIASYAAVSFGLLPKIFITEYGIQVGSAMELVLLSFALAYRMNLLKEENTRIARQARENLEARVTERTLELNEALGDLARANEQLQEASHRDGLTGVFNRRFFDAALVEHVEARDMLGDTLVLVMFDLDHFKAINDQRGHLAGDDALRTVAATVRLQLDEQSLLTRFGGEEFLIVRRGLGALEAVAFAETLRTAIGAADIVSGDQIFRLTASFGVRVVEPDEEVLDSVSVVRDVDAALYAAKAAGRNRTAIWHADGPRIV